LPGSLKKESVLDGAEILTDADVALPKLFVRLLKLLTLVMLFQLVADTMPAEVPDANVCVEDELLMFTLMTSAFAVCKQQATNPAIHPITRRMSMNLCPVFPTR
jgi:hypothetical protein